MFDAVWKLNSLTYPALIRLINIRLNGERVIREGSINILVETLIVLVFNTRSFLDAIEKNYPHLLQVMRNFDFPILKLYKSQWEFLRNHLLDDRLDKLFNEGYIREFLPNVTEDDGDNWGHRQRNKFFPVPPRPDMSRYVLNPNYTNTNNPENTQIDQSENLPSTQMDQPENLLTTNRYNIFKPIKQKLKKNI